MKTLIACIPCFFKQAIKAGKILELSDIQIKNIIDAVAAEIPNYSMTTPPPLMACIIQRIIKEKTQNPDPYYSIKQRSNRMALKAYPLLKQSVKNAENKLLQAVNIAIAGNIIDYGAIFDLDIDKEISDVVKNNNGNQAQEHSKFFSFSSFKRALENAHTILYLGDNSGEIVWDRILIEEIKILYPDKKITFAVRGEPTINDCLMTDARMCGIDTIATVISNGSDAPGTILETCSKEFLEIWETSDMIISKGQGNFESLSERQKRIFYLFIVKCEPLAREIGCHIRDTILYQSP